MFYPRTEAASRSDLLDLEGKVSSKADRASMDATLAAKVRYILRNSATSIPQLVAFHEREAGGMLIQRGDHRLHDYGP